MLEDSTKVVDSEKPPVSKEEQTVERYPWRSLNEITQFVTNHYKTRLNYERKKGPMTPLSNKKRHQRFPNRRLPCDGDTGVQQPNLDGTSVAPNPSSSSRVSGRSTSGIGREIEEALKKGVEFGFLRQDGDTFLLEEDDSDLEPERKQRKKPRRKTQRRESEEESETSGSDQCVECRYRCRLPQHESSESESDDVHMCAAAVRRRRVTLRCPHCGSDSELDTLVRPFRIDRTKQMCKHRSTRSFSTSSDDSCDHQYNRSRSPGRKGRNYNARSKSCRVPRRRRKHRERSRSRERRLINMQRTRQKSPPRSGNRINSRSMPRRSLTYWPRSPSPSKGKESSLIEEDRHSQENLPKDSRPHSILRNKTFGIRPHPVLSEEIIRGKNDSL